AARGGGGVAGGGGAAAGGAAGRGGTLRPAAGGQAGGAGAAGDGRGDPGGAALPRALLGRPAVRGAARPLPPGVPAGARRADPDLVDELPAALAAADRLGGRPGRRGALWAGRPGDRGSRAGGGGARVRDG